MAEEKYLNNHTKMRFICHCGEEGYKSFQSFKLSPMCRKCSSNNSGEPSREKKKFKYDDVVSYVNNNSNCIVLSKKYIRNSEKMKFLCGCGNEFSTTFAKFKNRGKNKCNSCSREEQNQSLRFSYDYVKRFVEKNDCILMENSYENNGVLMRFMCKCGNEFSTTFGKFKNRNQRQCYNCGQAIKNKTSLTVEDIQKYVEKFDCKLLSEKYTNAKTILNFKCPCKSEFSTTYEIFRMGKNRCDKCTGEQSKMEYLIEGFLQKNSIKYKLEYRFEDCRLIKPLPFDFAIFDDKSQIKCLIEADGIQHFRAVGFFGGEDAFADQQKRDEIKNSYCNENNIELIRIPYYEEKNIDTILRNALDIE